MPFDFDAAVQSPFRMQPGLRRLQAGAAQLTPLRPGAAHQRAKLAVLRQHAREALCLAPGFDPAPALHALCRQAGAEHPQAWQWDGRRARAVWLDLAWAEGQLQAGPRADPALHACLLALPAAWQLAGLLSLAFAEDFAVLSAADTRVPWLAVALPSHWAPREKVGQPFTAVHAPVADNALLLQAAPALARLVTGAERWERFVWTISPHGQLDAHPDRLQAPPWSAVAPEQAWWRTERQTFVPVPDAGQAVFTILVEVQPLPAAVAAPGRAARLHAALASMSPAVLAYRGLAPVRERLLAWLAARA